MSLTAIETHWGLNHSQCETLVDLLIHPICRKLRAWPTVSLYLFDATDTTISAIRRWPFALKDSLALKTG